MNETIKLYGIRNNEFVHRYNITIDNGVCVFISNSNIKSDAIRGIDNEKLNEYFDPIIIDKEEKLKIPKGMTHKVKIKYLGVIFYLFLNKKQQTRYGLIPKNKWYKTRLNETQRWFIELCVIILIGVGNWYFDFLPTRDKHLNDKQSDKTISQSKKNIQQPDTLSLIQNGQTIDQGSDDKNFENDSLQ